MGVQEGRTGGGMEGGENDAERGEGRGIGGKGRILWREEGRATWKCRKEELHAWIRNWERGEWCGEGRKVHHETGASRKEQGKGGILRRGKRRGTGDSRM